MKAILADYMQLAQEIHLSISSMETFFFSIDVQPGNREIFSPAVTFDQIFFELQKLLEHSNIVSLSQEQLVGVEKYFFHCFLKVQRKIVWGKWGSL